MIQRKTHLKARFAVLQSPPNQSLLEPRYQLDFGHCPINNINNHIVDPVAGLRFKAIAAALDQDEGRQPCSALVPVREGMARCKSVQQRSAFLLYPAVISVIRTPERALKPVDVKQPRTTAAKLQRLFMSAQRIRQRQTVVASDSLIGSVHR